MSQTEIEILEVKRLSKKNKNGHAGSGEEWIPSPTVLITFVGQSLLIEMYTFHFEVKCMVLCLAQCNVSDISTLSVQPNL